MTRNVISLLGIPLLCALASACDTSADSNDETQDPVLLVLDGEPIYVGEEIPAAFESLLQRAEEAAEDIEERGADDVAFRAFCVADCGSHMMSMNADACFCEDGNGCIGVDDGTFTAVSCGAHIGPSQGGPMGG